MIFGEMPDFEEILAVLKALQEEINRQSDKISLLSHKRVVKKA